MNEELLPCPFCGKSEALLVQQTGSQWSVCCGNCGVETIWIDGEKAAIARWNRRAQRKALTDEQVEAAITSAVRNGALSWLGYKKDDQGQYTLPELSKSDFQAARAIEAAHGIKDTP